MNTADKTSRRRADIVNTQSLLILRMLADASTALSAEEGPDAGGIMVTAAITAAVGLALTIETNWGVRFNRYALRAEFERIMTLQHVIYERGPDGAPGHPNLIQ